MGPWGREQGGAPSLKPYDGDASAPFSQATRDRPGELAKTPQGAATRQGQGLAVSGFPAVQARGLWAPASTSGPWETAEPALGLFLLATQMYFFYLVVNRASVCTSNNSKTDIDGPHPRHWVLILSQASPRPAPGAPEP